MTVRSLTSTIPGCAMIPLTFLTLRKNSSADFVLVHSRNRNSTAARTPCANSFTKPRNACTIRTRFPRPLRVFLVGEGA